MTKNFYKGDKVTRISTWNTETGSMVIENCTVISCGKYLVLRNDETGEPLMGSYSADLAAPGESGTRARMTDEDAIIMAEAMGNGDVEVI